MPRVALTDKQVDAFRRRASRVATHLFAERGYRSLSMRALAAELGCSAMAIYRYFGGKDELLAQVRADAFRRLAETQEEAASSSDDPLERIDRLGRVLVDFALAQPDAYSIMFELSDEATSVSNELAEQGYRAWLPLRTATADALAAGVLEGDPDTLANLLFAALHGLLSMHLAHKLQRGRRLEELLLPMLDLLRRGAAPATPEG